MLDIVHSLDWLQRFFFQNKDVLELICEKLMEVDTEDYATRNLQARIISRILKILYNHHKTPLLELIEKLCEGISDGEINRVDMALKTLIYLIEKIEDEI